MKLVPVDSSNIQAVGYDPQTKEMRVQFSGGAVYTHSGVSLLQHAQFIASKSKGQHYHQHFKDKFGEKKLAGA